MDKLFEIELLKEVFDYLKKLNPKHYAKILYNIRRAQVEQDAELFKKLKGEIWEFRTLFHGLQYRLLAFWDKTTGGIVVVVATHGFIKKTSKVPEKEIDKAIAIRRKYFDDKENLKIKNNENI